MSNPAKKRIIDELLASVEIPDSAYEKAQDRYKDLGEWFEREESRCSGFEPHIYSQGSFRLGTVIRPLNSHDEYDLDVGCRLRAGITKESHTQSELKILVGEDLEDYRTARGIKDGLEEMHRCWRLGYADTLKFHMDVVPSIPEAASRRGMIKEAMISFGSSDALAQTVAALAGSITDNRMDNYNVISDDWRVSNSEGYARWFEDRMKQAQELMEKHAFEAKAAKVDDLPAYRWKSPLQRCVQILKRHRDVMFAGNPEGKPISVIIQTLAASAYQGEIEIDDAMDRILSDMGGLVRPKAPRVPNPVNPIEDFADKWADPKYRRLNLEQNFWDWLEQAQADFEIIGGARDINLVVEQAHVKFAADLSTDGLDERLGFGAPSISVSPKVHEVKETPAKPWRAE